MKADIGFIGYGEVGYNFSLGLRKAGISMAAFARSREKVASKASDTGVTLVPSLEELVHCSKLVLSCVWADSALPIALACASHLGREQVFADVNSISPRKTEEILMALQKNGVSFVKIAILEPVYDFGFKVPMLAGGEKAHELAEALTGYGMNIRAIGTDPRKPAAIKILRSVYLKGGLAALFEMLMAAKRYGVVDEVLHLSSEFLAREPVEAAARKWLPSTLIHAQRRAYEMQEAAEAVSDAGIEALMSKSAMAVFQRLADRKLGHLAETKQPYSYEDVLKMLA